MGDCSKRADVTERECVAARVAMHHNGVVERAPSAAGPVRQVEPARQSHRGRFHFAHQTVTGLQQARCNPPKIGVRRFALAQHSSNKLADKDC